MTVTVSQKGCVVIPAELRRKHDLRPGTEVQVVDYGGVLALVPKLRDPVRQAAGMLKGVRGEGRHAPEARNPAPLRVRNHPIGFHTDAMILAEMGPISGFRMGPKIEIF